MATGTVLLECVALAILLRTRGIKGSKLAKRLDISPKLISKYMTSQIPPQDVLEKILAELEYTLEDYRELIEFLRRKVARPSSIPPVPTKTVDRAAAPVAMTPVDPSPEEWRELGSLAAQAGQAAERSALETLAAALRLRKAAAARAEAAVLCDRLLAEPKPWLAVETVREVQTWAVAEALAHRSADAAPERPDGAQELAALSYRVAELAPCTGPFRERLLGYTLTFGENALRAAHRLPEAEALFAEAEARWQAGAAAPGPLAEWRRLSLEGSLHRDQQRFAESLARLDASLASAPAEARGRLLVIKALTVEKMDDPEQAIALLQEAEREAGRQRDPRLAFFALANHTALLCRLGRFALAEGELGKLQAEAKSAGPELQRTWLRWIRGSVAAGLRRWGQAETHLAAAAAAFAARKNAWECALISLELAVLFCRCHKPREVHALVRGLAWIPKEAKLSRQALAALHLLFDAAEDSGVTLELAEQALQLLQRAPKADAPEETADLAPFAPAASSGGEPLSAGAGGGGDVHRRRRSRAVMAAAAGIEDAAAVQDVAGRGPEGGGPGGQAVEEAGGLGGGAAACRQRG